MDRVELGKAAWIWGSNGSRKNQYVALRLVVPGVTPATLPEPVPVQVSAGSLYRLYVNGHYLGRGPVREWAGHAGLDCHDLRPWLQPGRNVISVLAHFFGEKVGGYPLSPPGFLLAGTLGTTSLSTGIASWQVTDLNAWDDGAERISLYTGFNEWVNLDLWRPQVWEQGSDSAAWKTPVIVPKAAMERPHLEPRMIPPLAETQLPPMKLREMAENSMLFEAERMLSGCVEIELTAETPLELMLEYGDRLDEGVFVGDHGGVNLSLDRLRMEPGRHRWTGAFNLRGFRYVRLSWNGATQAPHDVRLIPLEIVYPTVLHAAFECSDAWIRRCRETACLTIRLCMADTYMDNPSRERQQYGGDGYIQALYGFELFGDTALWRQFLRHYAQGRRADGALQSGGPWCWNQVIPAWTLLWIESIREYCRHTRDRSIVEEYADAIEDASAWFEPMVGTDGLLTIEERFHWEGGEVLWNFIDWQREREQLKGEPARMALNGLYALGLDAAAEMLKLAGRQEAAARLTDRKERTASALAAVENLGEHGLVAATLAGAISGRMGEVAEMVQQGRSKTDVMYVFFTLKALVREGYIEAAMTLLRDIFEPMLQAEEHTTFWETRQVPPGSSRAICQAIGGAPAYWLPRLAAGIRDIDAGRQQVVFGMPLSNIAFARILLPCIDGDIAVSMENGSVREIHLPNGWKAVNEDCRSGEKLAVAP